MRGSGADLAALGSHGPVLTLLQPSDDSNIPLEDNGHNNSDAYDDYFPPAPENGRARLLPPPPPGDVPNALEDSDLDDDPLGIKDLQSCHNTPRWRNIDLPSTPRPSRTLELPGSLPLRRSIYREFQEMPPSPEPNQPATGTD